MNTHGPNVTKLITKFIARTAIPAGGGLADGLEFFTNPEHRKQVLAKAEADAIKLIQIIKDTPDNPYGDDDEVIAAVLVEKLDERTNAKRRHR